MLGGFWSNFGGIHIEIVANLLTLKILKWEVICRLEIMMTSTLKLKSGLELL